jgi:oligopeptide/dipeptide ABC transporter ATP-binding protein
MKKENILEIKNLSVNYPVHSGIFFTKAKSIQAVENIYLDIKKGETLGLVGESGCGKTTVSKAIINILKFNFHNTEIKGEILFDTGDRVIDILKLKSAEMRKLRGDIQIIFQDPYSSLDSRMTVKQIIEEPLLYHTRMNKKQRYERILYLLEKVGLQTEQAKYFPHEFSGGQRQRIGIARALATNPKLIIADEPVSALDVSIQAQIINLLQDLQKEFNLSLLFIAHDLSVVRHISSRIAIMYLGKIIEIGDSDEIYSKPLHPYSKALISSIPLPKVNTQKRKRIILKGEVPNATNKPSGCVFRTRCPIAMSDCAEKIPELVNVGKGRYVACLYT